MKIISTKEYNKLMKTKSDYLDLLWKPLQGAFEKVTDDDLLRENGLLNAENERLTNELNQCMIDHNKLLDRIDKTIDYIEKNCILSDTWKELDFCNFVSIGEIKYKPLSSKKVKELLKILKGDDKK